MIKAGSGKRRYLDNVGAGAGVGIGDEGQVVWGCVYFSILYYINVCYDIKCDGSNAQSVLACYSWGRLCAPVRFVTTTHSSGGENVDCSAPASQLFRGRRLSAFNDYLSCN